MGPCRWALLVLCASAVDVVTEVDPFPNPDLQVQCKSTKGDFTVNVVESWSPRGARQFTNMVKSGFYDQGVAFFRVVPRFLTQFGISNNVTKSEIWRKRIIKDDPNQKLPFKRGYMSFAGGGPNTRGTQTFITFSDSDFLGKAPWETPFGYIDAEGMTVIDSVYSGYGDLKPFGGAAPDQGRIQAEGGSYLATDYPMIDYITKCEIPGSRGSGMGRARSAQAMIVRAEEELGPYWATVVILGLAVTIFGGLAWLARVARAARKND